MRRAALFGRACGRSGAKGVLAKNYRESSKAMVESHQGGGDVVQNLADRLGWSYSMAFGFMSLHETTYSLNLPKAVEDDYEDWIESVQGEGSNPEEEFFEAYTSKCIEEAMQRLTERERSVLKGRFSKDQTYREIGEPMGVSGERVRQIAEVALSRVRRPLMKLNPT